MKKSDVLRDKSKVFALRIINLYNIYVNRKVSMFYQNRCCEVEPV